MGLVLVPTVSDTFTASNGTNLVGHSPDIGPGAWSVDAGSFDIQSNRAHDSSVDTGLVRYSKVESGLANCTVQVTANSGTQQAASYTGVLFRTGANSANDSFVFFALNDGASTTVGIERKIAGAGVTVGTGTLGAPLAANTDYTLKVVLLGTSIKCYVNGVEYISITDAAMTTNTKHGLWSYYGLAADSGHTFDNFTVATSGRLPDPRIKTQAVNRASTY